MAASRNSKQRIGTVLPMLGVCLIALFSFVALAVDLGMVAVARTDAQNAADIAALAGTRTLNNKPGVTDSNRTNAIAAAKAALKLNNDVNAVYTDAEIQSVKAGQYNYDTNTQTFSVSYPTSIATGQSWTAMEVKIAVQQPTFFMKIWGVTAMPTGARAVAVHRPRDIALAIDMTGSMGYGSLCRLQDKVGTAGPGLNDPSTMWPQFSHNQRYTAYSTNAITGSQTGTVSGRPNPFQQMGSQTSAPYLYAPANLTIETPNGAAIVRDFYYDPSNLANMANPVTSTTATALKNAFHQWSPAETPGTPASYIGPTYTWTGYNAFDTTGTTGAMPAPDNFKTQSDSPITYVGDKFPRKYGATTDTGWSPTDANGAAINLAEYLGWCPKYTGSGTWPGSPPVRTSLAPTTSYPVSADTGAAIDWTNFRDATWERYGYDLDVADYVSSRGTWDPRWDWDNTLNGGSGGWAHTRPSGWTTTNTYRPSVTDGKFKGYSMGPGYFGKTFVIWPPDPRTPVGNPGESNYQAGDWRRRYFYNRSGAAFDPQTDSDGSVSNFQNIDNELHTAGTGATLTASSGNWAPNYTAILKWIKSGPMTLPPNLRSGHVLYYSSIPDSVTASAGDSNEVSADKVFWKTYIDFVIRNGDLAGTEPAGWPEGVTPNIDTSAPTSAPGYALPTPVAAGTTPGYYNASSPSFNLVSGSGGASKSGSTYTFNTTAAHGFSAGQWVVIENVTNTTYNGTYVIATVPNTTRFTVTAANTTTVAASGSGKVTLASKTDPAPYSSATNNPSRPRLHFWFGPITMMLFLNEYNMWSGTTHQAQSWQLKAGVNSALDDIRSNHPNDYCGMAFFTTPRYTDIMVPIGQDYATLKNSLFFPKTLLTQIGSTSPNAEFRPYDSNGLVTTWGNIPNSQSNTDPVTGMALSFNILSPAPSLNTDASRRGRRGANKVVIFETDGIPNSTQPYNLQMKGYNSYYTYGGSTPVSDSSNAAIAVVAQICKPTATDANTGTDSGYSLPNAPARVYAIGFGDIFSTSSATTAKTFLLNIQKAGNTSKAVTDADGPADTAIPSYQIITGPYQTRIDNLRTALERILQGGVQVTLIE